MKTKREARILALQVLFAYDLRNGEDFKTVFEAIISNSTYQKDVLEYAKRLLEETLEQCREVDLLLQRHAQNWDIKRMAAIDRNILRLAISEIRSNLKVPVKVAIDEAVELSKIYGSDESSKFVNGVIDAICRDIKKTK
jgi:N utilization substance protein B